MVKILIKRQTAQCFIENLGNGVGLDMVLLRHGSFIMGAPKTEEGSSDYEGPQHQVTVSTFFMGKYPVTQAQWRAVATLPQVNKKLNPDPSNFKGDQRPVEQVSWYDAVEFCDRLAAHTKREYALPSEAEWEYACRAGTTTPFHFGETITSELANYKANESELANYKANEVYGQGVKGETTPVGSFEVANAFGLYDMHGNVWEWCLDDWHNKYERAPNDGSSWSDNNLPQRQRTAVLRGGSWLESPKSCRSASRDFKLDRDALSYNFGFRVVCAVGKIFQ